MTFEKPYYLLGSKTTRPSSNCTLFVDGTSDDTFREGIDQELSHWFPNKTKEKYKSGTSTEICFNYMDDNPSLPYDLVINNHLDIDGILSVFVLSYPTVALQYRKEICDAANTGDFWGWSEGKALSIFQELTSRFPKYWSDKTDNHIAFTECFEVILKILNSPIQKENAHTILDQQLAFVEQGFIQRKVLTERLVSYFVPKDLTKDKECSYLHVPEPNALITDKSAFWPQVRNYFDQQKLHLVGIETEKGIHYDLWFPGYLWAQTKGLWRPRNFIMPDDMLKPYEIEWPELGNLIQELQLKETGTNRWDAFPKIYLFDHINPRNYPIVASSLGQSHLPWEAVCESFANHLHMLKI